MDLNTKDASGKLVDEEHVRGQEVLHELLGVNVRQCGVVPDGMYTPFPTAAAEALLPGVEVVLDFRVRLFAQRLGNGLQNHCTEPQAASAGDEVGHLNCVRDHDELHEFVVEAAVAVVVSHPNVVGVHSVPARHDLDGAWPSDFKGIQGRCVAARHHMDIPSEPQGSGIDDIGEVSHIHLIDDCAVQTSHETDTRHGAMWPEASPA